MWPDAFVDWLECAIAVVGRAATYIHQYRGTIPKISAHDHLRCLFTPTKRIIVLCIFITYL